MIKRVLLGIVGLVAILAVISQFLPGDVHVERQVTIKAAPEAVFPFVNSPKMTEKWSPWLERDPKTIVKYDGPAAGVGAKMAWQSDNREVGIGSSEIIESKLNTLVRVALAFEGQGNAIASYMLKGTGDSTVLVWGFDSELGRNPVMRYMGLMFESWIGKDYERGLANIKKLVEGG